jgi:alpha,alpha-trehalose phosphorylase
MIPREFQLLPEHLYPSEEWAIVENGFDLDWMGNAETVFSLSNGFLGIRGTFEEGRPFIEPGTFCNGFHETWQIVHAEEAYGFAKTGQTIVNVPDATILKLYVDDEPLYLPTARVTQYVRRLDFRSGVLVRELNWSTPSGKQVQLTSRRLISLENRHLGAISYEITTDTDAPIVVSSQMLNRQDSRAEDEPLTPGGSDPRRARAFSKRVLNARSHVEDDLRIAAGYRTTNSRMSLGVGIDHRIETENHWELQRSWSDDLGKVVFVIDGKADQPIRVTKFFSYHTSRSVPATELVDRSSRTLDRAVRMGYSELERQQQAFLDHFWERSDIVIDAEPRVQQAVRWNLFQLCQSSARAETTGIPAKGLSGQAYEGHYFWDTEIYVVPFLTFTEPRIARNPSSVPSQYARQGTSTSSGAFRGTAPSSRGARSTATKRRRTMPRERRSTTSTPTSPTPSSTTCRPARTMTSSPRSAWRSSSRRHGCGTTSGSSAPIRGTSIFTA